MLKRLHVPGQRRQQRKQAKHGYRRDHYALAADRVGQPPADQGAEKQPERAGAEERSDLVRAGSEFRNYAAGCDARGLQIDALAEHRQQAADDRCGRMRRAVPAVSIHWTQGAVFSISISLTLPQSAPSHLPSMAIFIFMALPPLAMVMSQVTTTDSGLDASKR